ncbi:hypothetical protein chiPu_0030232 [Chiloscyllium punctatum]|uniref:Uncharacterized protein n=1 Tax=Chiloscyllium punctatum TaxID=137246 RepID=A0A401TTE1_CHIPU|nr:hypothetical protein [Chiloscyllium punctatum]
MEVAVQSASWSIRSECTKKARSRVILVMVGRWRFPFPLDSIRPGTITRFDPKNQERQHQLGESSPNNGERQIQVQSWWGLYTD